MKIRVITFFTVAFLIVVSCVKGEDVQPKTHSLVLKKSIVVNFDSFNVNSNGLEIFRSQKAIPLGLSEIRLSIDLPKSDLLLFWYDEITSHKTLIKRVFPFEDCNEIWLNGIQYMDNEVDSVLAGLGGVELILSNRQGAMLEYSHDLLTFCSKYLTKNPEIGFRRIVYQRMNDGGSLVDTTFESRYILLNEIVFNDLIEKGFVNSKDTVYLIDKTTEKVNRKLFSDDEIQKFVNHWE